MLKQLVIGAATFIPGVSRLKRPATGGTDNARYCYAVWLRHLVKAAQNGLATDPRIVAELGPGDSLGIGFAALLTGAEQYYAFDIKEYANASRNLLIFDELVDILLRRASIPGSDEFPETRPLMSSYDFPSSILGEERMTRALHPSRVARLRESLRSFDERNSAVRYVVPWYGKELMQRGTVDMVFSQAVLEHVDDLPATYRAIHEWLAPDGYMSHQIDLRSHGTANTWNGHWEYSDLTWRVIRGNRAYLINRQPLSMHLRLLNETGFEVKGVTTETSDPGHTAARLARRFRDLTPEDLATSGVFMQMKKV